MVDAAGECGSGPGSRRGELAIPAPLDRMGSKHTPSQVRTRARSPVWDPEGFPTPERTLEESSGPCLGSRSLQLHSEGGRRSRHSQPSGGTRSWAMLVLILCSDLSPCWSQPQRQPGVTDNRLGSELGQSGDNRTAKEGGRNDHRGRENAQ